MPVHAQAREMIFGDNRSFPSCHASTLLLLPGGEVLAAWFGGTREKASDVAIWQSRRSAAGEWSDPVISADEEGIAHWNPVLFRLPDGSIALYYKVGHEIPDWYTRVIVSQDNGMTWSAPKQLVERDIGGRGPVKNKPITLKGGTIIAPASLERRVEGDGKKELWDAFVDISRDGGQTWVMSEVPLDRTTTPAVETRANGLIQPTLWEAAAGGVHMLLRSTYGSIYRSDSSDGGQTWCQAYPIGLPNNNSGIDAVRMDSGTIALVYNPVSAVRGGARSPLVIRFSTDNGRTWKDEFILESEPGEFSYPAIIADGLDLHVTYTWNREKITYWKLSLTE